MDVQETLRLRSGAPLRTPNAACIMAQPVEIVMTSIGGGGRVGFRCRGRRRASLFSGRMRRAPELTKGRRAFDQSMAQRLP
jgi:hypothetical protein